MLANPLLLSLGSELGGGSWCCKLTGSVDISANMNLYTINYKTCMCNVLFAG